MKKNIAVFMAGWNDNICKKILTGVKEKAQAENYHITIINCFGGIDEKALNCIGEYNIFELPLKGNFDGAIVIANIILSKKAKKILFHNITEAGIPAVCLEEEIPGQDFVGIDNYQAMRPIVEHFVKDHHYTKIDFITGPPGNKESNERLRAYKEVLRENDIKVDSERIFIGLYNYDSGIDAARKICAANHEMPEAIVCANDEMAIAVCEVLRKQGIRIPEDVAVSGFDNIEDAKTYAPRITSVERPMFDMGFVACEKLIDRIKAAESEMKPKAPQKYLLETKCIFNESCGCEQPDTLSYEDFRRNYFYQKYHTYTHGKKLKQMSENMILCENLKEYAHYFKDNISLLEAKSIYLCVNTTEFVVSNQSEAVETLLLKKNIRTQGYHNRMKVLFAAQNDKAVSVKDFPLTQIFPDIQREEPTVFEISPIHFQDRAIGYLITEDSIFVENRELYFTWLQSLSNTYQSVWSKEQLNTVIKSLSDLYIRDSLTGLYNRFGYQKYGMEMYQQVRCQRQCLMFLFADVDGLKKINDLYGHEQGDFSIRSIGGILHMLCPGNGITVRYGGDEFMMIIPGYDQIKADQLTKVIEAELARFSRQQELDFSLELSCGVYILEETDGKTSLDECMKIADTRMYEIKKKKKAERQAE